MKRIITLVPIAVTLAGCQICEHCRSFQPNSTVPAVAAPTAAAHAWTIPITPATASIEFTGATTLSSQPGHFEAFDGTLELPTEKTRGAALRVVVDMESTTTAIKLLTRHLKGADFFDVAKYPRAEFVSETITPTSDDGLYQVRGTLDFHGTQKPIEFPAKLLITPSEIMFDASLVIRQTEFGMIESARKTKDDVPVHVSLRHRRVSVQPEKSSAISSSVRQ